MKLLKNKTALLITAILAAGFAQLGFAGIAGTPHNLNSAATIGAGTGASTGPVSTWSGTDEICVFCHTPHGSDTSAVVPLWNKTLDATPAATYATYDDLGTSSLDGDVAQIGSVSIACLSCHDGQQAMDAMINEPGSGLDAVVTPTGTGWAGSAIADGKMAAGIALLGTDLQDDHPVGIVYGGEKANSAVDFTVGPFTDVDFNVLNTATLNGNTVWWVDDADPLVRSKTEIQLYTRVNATASDGATTITGTLPYVECASCHDPHTDVNPTFLRKSNTGSAVCLSCHNK